MCSNTLNFVYTHTVGSQSTLHSRILTMDEYDELYGANSGHNDSAYGNQDIYADDHDNSQSYDPEKATLYSNPSSKAEDPSGQAQRKGSDANYEQQGYYGDSEKSRGSPQERSYNRDPEQGQAIQSFSGEEDHEAHPSVASAANQDEG